MANFLRDYEAEMKKYTDAPDIYHRAVASTLLGSVLTTYDYRLRLFGGTSALYPNLWTFIIGDSANSRKSTTVNMGAEVLEYAAKLDESLSNLRSPDDGSPEGFAKDFVVKENQKKGNAASMMVQSEMGAFLANMKKDYNTGFKQMMMDFFDSPPRYKRKLSREEFEVHRPRFSMLGALAVEFMPSMLTADDWQNGFMSRALLIYARRDRSGKPATPSSNTYRGLARQLIHTAQSWRRNRKRLVKKHGNEFLLRYDVKAEKRAEQLSSEVEVGKLNPVMNTLLGRKDLHLLKLSAIEQVAMNPETDFITEPAVEAANVLWQHWLAHAETLLEGSFARSNADTEGDRVPRRILRVLQEAPHGLEERDLLEATILDFEKFSKALMTLEHIGAVERVEGVEGGPAIIRRVERRSKKK